MFDDLGALLRSAQRDVLIMTPYFVPGSKGMAMIEAMRQRGVRVRILTAALAATDAPAGARGLQQVPRARCSTRGGSLRAAARVHAAAAPRHGGVHSRTNLHAKAIAVDGRTVLVGSMNIDPRSDKHNTEMGLLLRSDTLARRLEEIDRSRLHGGAYRLVTNGDGELRWRYTAARRRRRGADQRTARADVAAHRLQPVVAAGAGATALAGLTWASQRDRAATTASMKTRVLVGISLRPGNTAQAGEGFRHQSGSTRLSRSARTWASAWKSTPR